MSALRTAAQHALEALEKYRQMMLAEAGCRWGGGDAAIAALRAALAQEQVAPTVKESLQVEPATTQQPADEAPPSDYRRGYWAGFAIGKREGRIEAEDAAKQAEPKEVGNLPPPWRCACGANLYIDEYGHPASRAAPRYEKPQQDEPAQEPVAVVGTQVDVWRGCDGRWAPPGEPIKTALMLKDMPVGTMLYTTPPRRKPLSGLEVERLLEQVIGSLHPVARNLVRAVERAHGIVTCGDTKERA